MLIDLHVYTDASGGEPLSDTIAELKGQKLDALCVVDRQASAAVARGVEAGEYDFPVFVGVEIPTRTGDVVIIPPKLDPFLTREEWRQLEVLELPTLEQVQKLAEEEGAVVLVSHPYDRDRRNGPRDRIFAFDNVAAIEVATGSAELLANAASVEAVSYASVPGFAGSSATRRKRANGQWATLFATEVKTQEELVAALRAGDFWAVEVLDPSDRSQGRTRGGGGGGRRRSGGDGGGDKRGGRRSGGRRSGGGGNRRRRRDNG